MHASQGTDHLIDLTREQASGRGSRALLAVLALAAATFVLLLQFHVTGINGPSYWRWPWIDTPFWRFWPWYSTALIPFIIAQWRYRRVGARRALPWLAFTCLALQLFAQGVLTEPFSLKRLAKVIKHPVSHGYLQAAHSVTEKEDWLGKYPHLLQHFPLHARTKPPGIVVIYRLLIRLFSPAVPAVAALGLTFLAVLGARATFALAMELMSDRDAAFAAASQVALSPGIAAFCPSFDAVYPALAALLILCWHRTLRRGRGWPLAFGALLFGVTLLAYNLLVLGYLCLALSIAAWRGGWLSLRSLVARSATALFGTGALYLVANLITGFDPIATFRSALRIQAQLAHRWGRPWPDTAVFDLTDFLMATGWISLVPAAAAMVRALADRNWPRAALLASLLSQPMVVAATGLLAAETFRVWLFILPLYATVVGVELGRWSATARNIYYALVAIVGGSVLQNLFFVPV